MNVSDTKPPEKKCSKCNIVKSEKLFVLNRNICKKCRNYKCREKYNLFEINKAEEQKCNCCEKIKPILMFIKNRKICIECNNYKRRIKYDTDEEHRNILIKKATEFKQKQILNKNKQKEEELGVGNTMCNYCNIIKPSMNFRNDRLKCKCCENNDPINKLKRVIRSRIISAINSKSKHTAEYLGCNIPNYLNWLLNNNEHFTFENRGKEWHIDHVIPLSKFDLNDEAQQLIAFNWRNTMALSCEENLKKGNKIINSQVEQHYKNLVDYHLKYNLDLPQVYINLFAKHLDVREVP